MEPDEWYVAKLTEISEGSGQYGPYKMLRFKLLNGRTENGGPAKGQTTVAFVGLPKAVDGTYQITPKSSICKLLKAFGVNVHKIFEEDAELDIDLDQYIGHKIKLLIEDAEKKSDDGTLQQRVAKNGFMRYKPKVRK